MDHTNSLPRFEQVFLPHLKAAYNLARWLARNDHDAEDLAQEAYLRALRSFDTFRGVDGRAWLLTIVRNTWRTWAGNRQKMSSDTPFNEEIHVVDPGLGNPETFLVEQAGRDSLHQALEDLPDDAREMLVLRELEGLSYREIAEVTGLRPGTVMSRLSRARRRLSERLGPQKESHVEL